MVTALAYQACIKGDAVLFASAIDIINNLTVAQCAELKILNDIIMAKGL